MSGVLKKEHKPVWLRRMRKICRNDEVRETMVEETQSLMTVSKGFDFNTEVKHRII